MTLTIIILVLLIFAFAGVIFRISPNSKTGFGSSGNSNPYSKKSRILNQTEHALYINLLELLGGDYIVFSKVRIEDFVTADYAGTSFAERYGNRNRIKSRHVDFLICDKRDTRPLLAIELDGGSHNSPDRISRDEFVDSLYHQIKLPIKHIHVGSNFEVESKIIKDELKTKT